MTHMQLSLFNLEPSEKEVSLKPVRPKQAPQLTIKSSLKPKTSSTDPTEAMRNALLPHLPEEGLDFVIHWLVNNNVQLRITRSRSSKLGD